MQGCRITNATATNVVAAVTPAKALPAVVTIGHESSVVAPTPDCDSFGLTGVAPAAVTLIDGAMMARLARGRVDLPSGNQLALSGDDLVLTPPGGQIPIETGYQSKFINLTRDAYVMLSGSASPGVVLGPAIVGPGGSILFQPSLSSTDPANINITMAEGAAAFSLTAKQLQNLAPGAPLALAAARVPSGVQTYVLTKGPLGLHISGCVQPYSMAQATLLAVAEGTDGAVLAPAPSEPCVVQPTVNARANVPLVAGLATAGGVLLVLFLVFISLWARLRDKQA